MAAPKRHHYIPEFYLQSFSRKGSLWVYDRTLKEHREQTPKNTTLQTHYYTIDDGAGGKNTEIEQILGRVEGATKPVISKLENIEPLTSDDRDTLALFVSIMRVRVPDFEEEVNELAGAMIRKSARIGFGRSEAHAEAFLKRFQTDTGKDPSVSAKELLEFVRGDNYDVEMHRNFSLGMMMDLVLQFAGCFRHMDWLFVKAPEKTSFVTSDSPFILIPPPDWKPALPYGIGVLTPGTEKLIPLSQTIAMAMLDEGDHVHFKQGTQETVRKMNLTVTASSRRFVISRDELLLKSLVQRTRIDKVERGKRMRIGF